MNKKISIIGAGSAVFSLNLIKDLCSTPSLEKSIICLMDIDQKRLEGISTLLKRYAQEMMIHFEIQTTINREECLKDADFVINTALAADHSWLREGWKIGKELGYRIGGSLHIMHDEAFWVNFYQLRLQESILKDILKICPNAWYLIVANPVAAGVTYLSRKYPEAKLVGICHGSNEVYSLADELGLEREHISFEAPGINHFIWLTKFLYKGEDAFHFIDDYLDKKGPDFWENMPWKYGLGSKAFDLYKKFGAFPIGDTCTPGGGSWPFWYHTDNEKDKWKEDPEKWYEEHFISGKKEVEDIFNAGADKRTKVSDVYPQGHSNEIIVPLIESLAFDKVGTYIVNIPNSGEFVPGIPNNFQVEVLALASGKGIQGIRTDGLPAPLIKYIYRDRIASIEMEIEAFITGSKELMIQLILMDPWTKTRNQAEQLFKQIVELPFNDEMKRYFN